MRCLILGHSYVRDLSTLGVQKFNINQQSCDFIYKFIPGASYDTFLNNSSLLENKVACNPDIVVVILGGNSIVRDISNHELFRRCRRFYETLRTLLPNSLIISAQVELRPGRSSTRFESPPPWIFKQRRNQLNKFLNRLKVKDHMIIIAGPGKLDNPIYYRDHVHLNIHGLRLYMSSLKIAVSRAWFNKVNNLLN